MQNNDKLRRGRERPVLRGSLQGVDAGGFHALTMDGSVVRLNGMAAGILSLCDGNRTRLDIVEQVSGGGLDTTHSRMVGDFLDAALRSGWIVLRKPARLAYDGHATLAGSSGCAYT